MGETLSGLTAVSSGSMTFERRSFELGQGTKGNAERLSDDQFDIPAEASSIRVTAGEEENGGEQLELREAGNDARILAFAGIRRVTLAKVLFAQRMYPPEREKLLEALERSSVFRWFTEACLKECGLDVARNLYLPIHNREVKFRQSDGRGRNRFSATWAMRYKATTSENNGNQTTS